MTEHGHPLELDVQNYVDGAAVPADVSRHIEGCEHCHRIADAMRATPPAEPPSDDTIAALVSAASTQAAPTELLAALAADPPEPAEGQVWQLAWDCDVVLGLLAVVSLPTVTVWPCTLDTTIADQTALLFDAHHTPLAADLVCWPEFATVVGSFALHTCLLPVANLDVTAIATTWASGDVLPSGWERGPDRDITESCWRESAELADRLVTLASASWRDPTWDNSGDHDDAAQPLADVLSARGLTAAWLATTLGVTERVAIALYRGSRDLTREERSSLADALGASAEFASRPDPDVLDALDRPTLRRMLREVASAEGTDEIAVRRSLSTFRAAARQVDDRHHRDVVAQLRVELARRLDAANTQ